MSKEAAAELAPSGTLRAGINLSNFLLVSGVKPDGEPYGVAPDMAAAIAAKLGVGVRYVTFKSPGALADMAGKDAWDIGLIGAEPERAKTIAFTKAYVEIEATYLVPPGSPLKSLAEVDRTGVRVASTARAAYDLWLSRNLKSAKLLHADTLDGAFELFAREKLEALAGLRPKLISDAVKMPGSRILDGYFMTVQQAIGTASANRNGAAFLEAFVAEAKRTSLIASLIEKHKVKGLSVAK